MKKFILAILYATIYRGARKIIPVLLLALLAALGANAQSTTVTSTVTDAGGVAWVGGSYTFSFVGPAQVTWPGGTVPRTVTGTLDSSGAFSQSLADVNTISPSPTFWTLKVCPITGIVQSCFIQASLTITGATQPLTVTPPAISIPGSSALPVAAYADAEIAAPVPRGFIYYQVASSTTGAYRQCQGLTGAACTTWASIAAGAPAVPCGANTQIQFNNAGACGADANLTWDPTTQIFSVAGSGGNGFFQASEGAGGANTILLSNATLDLFANVAGSALNISADAAIAINSNGSILETVPAGNSEIEILAGANGIALAGRAAANEVEVGAVEPGGVVQIISNAGISIETTTSGSTSIGNEEANLLEATFDGKLGFFAATPVVKPTVTGSQNGNPALASFLTSLANEGLITDGTTTGSGLGTVSACGTTVACANTAVPAGKMVFGTVPLTSGTPSTATLTGLPFASSSSYVCTATEQTSATGNLLKVANVSGASAVITGPAAVSDVINYICVGS